MCLSSEIAYFLSHILSFIHTQCFVMKILKHKVYYKLDENFSLYILFHLAKILTLKLRSNQATVNRIFHDTKFCEQDYIKTHSKG